MKVTEIAIVDELASSAELVMGKTLGVPAALIRGYKYDNQTINLDDFNSFDLSIKSIFRDKNNDLFRNTQWIIINCKIIYLHNFW